MAGGTPSVPGLDSAVLVVREDLKVRISPTLGNAERGCMDLTKQAERNAPPVEQKDTDVFVIPIRPLPLPAALCRLETGLTPLKEHRDAGIQERR